MTMMNTAPSHRGRRTALIVSFSDVNRDARVARYVTWLLPNYEVTLVDFTPYRSADVRSICVGTSRRSLRRKLSETLWGKAIRRAYEEFYWSSYDFSALKPLYRERFDVIIANEYTALPLVFDRLHAGAVVFDAHEYTPAQFNDPMWKAFHRGYATAILRRYMDRADLVTTVSEGVAEEYEKFCGIRPAILTNAAPYHELAPRPVDPDRIRIIHHGGAGRSRRIEEMIRMMRFTDRRFELHLMLVGGDDESYRRRLYRMAGEYPNARTHEPVAQHQLVPEINQYDIGLYIAPGSTINQRFMLPNKLFEFIQARLMVAIGPTVEMRRIVDQHGVGIVSPDFRAETMARLLNRLSAADIVAYKARTSEAARSLSAESNRDWYLEKLERLVSKKKNG